MRYKTIVYEQYVQLFPWITIDNFKHVQILIELGI